MSLAITAYRREMAFLARAEPGNPFFSPHFWLWLPDQTLGMAA